MGGQNPTFSLRIATQSKKGELFLNYVKMSNLGFGWPRSCCQPSQSDAFFSLGCYCSRNSYAFSQILLCFEEKLPF